MRVLGTLACLLATLAVCAGIALASNPSPAQTADATSLREAEALFIDGDRAVSVRLVSLDSEPGSAEAALEAFLAERAYPQEARVPDGGVTAAFAPPFAAWDVADIPVQVHRNPALQTGRPDLETAIEFAIAAWNDIPGSLFSFEYAGTGDALTCNGVSPNEDGLNVVRYESLPTGTLGITCSIWFVATGQLTEFDMELSASVSWSDDVDPPGQYDLWTTVLHEFGHALGLSHPVKEVNAQCPRGQVMQLDAATGTSVRELCPDDIDALLEIYADPQVTATESETPTSQPSETPTTPAPTATATESPTPTIEPPGERPFRVFAPFVAKSNNAPPPPPPSPTPTPTPTPTNEPTASPTATTGPSATPPATSTPTASATPTSAPTGTATIPPGVAPDDLLWSWYDEVTALFDEHSAILDDVLAEAISTQQAAMRFEEHHDDAEAYESFLEGQEGAFAGQPAACEQARQAISLSAGWLALMSGWYALIYDEWPFGDYFDELEDATDGYFEARQLSIDLITECSLALI